MNPIVIEASQNIAPEDRGIRTVAGGSWMDREVVWAAEGYVVTPHSYEYDGVTHRSDKVAFTEFAPVRSFSFKNLRAGIVATIGGQNYMIRAEVETEDDDGGGIPRGATVTFIPVDMPETPWAPWDEEAAKAETLAYLRRDIEQMKADEDAEWNKEFITRNERQIEEIESGKRRLRPRGDVLLFGQPEFLQGEMFPAHEGKAAKCLMVLETGWGDSGNINLLFTQDAEGRPNKVWFEASCC